MDTKPNGKIEPTMGDYPENMPRARASDYGGLVSDNTLDELEATRRAQHATGATAGQMVGTTLNLAERGAIVDDSGKVIGSTLRLGNQPNGAVVVARANEATAEVHVYVSNVLDQMQRKIDAMRELMQTVRTTVEDRNHAFVAVADEVVAQSRVMDGSINKLGTMISQYARGVIGQGIPHQPATPDHAER
jgi:hypothetical protein